MARRPSEDVVGFRRIFILFCTLVVVPAIAASSFGIVAIRNEASAEKQRIRERAEAEIHTAQALLFEELTRIGEALEDASRPPIEVIAELRSEGAPIGPVLLPIAIAEPNTFGALSIDMSKRAAALMDAAPPPSVAHFVGVDGQTLVATHTLTDTQRIAFVVDEATLVSRVANSPAADSDIVLQLTTPPRAESAFVGAVENLMAELSNSPDTPGRVVVASAQLHAPFDHFRMIARAPPAKGGLKWTYIILLLVFYAALITGVVLVSRLIWRETKLSRLKTDFVSHVSHELRTPLTSIRMFIETLRLGRAESPEEQEECLDLLAKETERLSDMIERVLGYARLKSGRRIFSIAPVLPQVLVEDALDAFRAHTVYDDEIVSRVTIDVAAGLPAVQADKEAIVEVLVNLLGNAFKYTQGDKRIRLFAFRRRQRVVFGVEDNGPGLDKSEHKRIFDRFYRVGPLLSQRTQEGSGLGLAIAKGIVDGHHGRMSVESVLGEGSTFTVELPIAPVDARVESGGGSLTAHEEPC